MELTVIRALVACFGFLVCSTILANDDDRELTFYEILSQQEEQEYQTLINNIKSMDDVQYRAFLTQRINQSYANKHGSVSGFVMVDVTEEINQPEPGFFARLFLSSPTEQEYGVNKVEQLLGETASNKLTYQPHFSNTDQQHSFQWVEGRFSKQQAMALVAKKDIVDLHLVDSTGPAWSQMIAFDLTTGRVLPPKVQKEYSDEELKAGFYSDLMKRFEKTDTSIVSMDFHSQERIGDERTADEIATRDQEIADFLNAWRDYDFEVLYKSDNLIYMKTNKAHVEAMKDHPLVTIIAIGDDLFLEMVQP